MPIYIYNCQQKQQGTCTSLWPPLIEMRKSTYMRFKPKYFPKNLLNYFLGQPIDVSSGLDIWIKIQYQLRPILAILCMYIVTNINLQIVIGGWQNTKSVIRRGKQGLQLTEARVIKSFSKIVASPLFLS